MEKWKDIEGYEGIYQVSNTGKVISLDRIVLRNNKFPIRQKGKEISQGKRSGYKVVQLQKNDIRKGFQVHRLVAQTFIPNPQNKPQVNHIDGNKLNNNVDNLEWTTPSENIIHALDNGLSSRIRPNNIQVLQFDKELNFVRDYVSINEADRVTKVGRANIRRCCLGEYKQAGGYIWKYK